MQTAYVGGRLRQLREERKLSQADLARALQISPSYLNQLEHNSRPLTVPVLLRISETFGVDASFFAPQDTTRLVAELGEVLLDDDLDARVSGQELSGFVTTQPRLAQAVVTMHRPGREAGRRTRSAAQRRA